MKIGTTQRKWAGPLLKDHTNLWIKSASEEIFWKMVRFISLNSEKTKKKQTSKQNQDSTNYDSYFQSCVTFSHCLEYVLI